MLFRQNSISLAALLLVMQGICLSAVAAEPQWQSLISTIDTAKQAVAGEWTKTGNELTVRAAQGARLALAVSPQGEYDFKASFTRKTGQHSIGLIIVYGGRQVVFEVDAWGKNLAGFQDVGGKSIRDNPMTQANVKLDNNKRYTLTVEVRKGELRGLLDGKEIAKLATDGSNISLPDVWKIPNRDQLGLVAWESDTTFHTVEFRSLSSAAPAVTRNTTAPVAPEPNRPVNPEPTKPTADLKTKRVLIVIANHHFFYREYGDPRQELERAGIRVTVAAARKAQCRPHDGSGQGADGGVVMADMALSDVKAKDFDAILFSGGWGASAYQFAFNGRYNDATYNGERSVKTEVNRVINEFVQQDKYVCGLCNGVSVLAWARVDGKSPLAGKQVCAPVTQAPPGVYNGRQSQPSCRWHPESNGAVMSPAGAVGQPGTPVDDVMVDGKIITGEDDKSAREMGRRIVEVLTR